MINKYLIVLLFFNLQLSVFAQLKVDTIHIDNLDMLWKVAMKNNSSQKIYQLKNQQ